MGFARRPCTKSRLFNSNGNQFIAVAPVMFCQAGLLNNIQHHRSVFRGIKKCAITLRVRRNTWFQASATKYLRTSLFWVIMQLVVVIPYRGSGGNFSAPSSREDSWPLKMGPIDCPETSVRNILCHAIVFISWVRFWRKTIGFVIPVVFIIN